MVVIRKRQGNRGAKNKTKDSGMGYLRVGNGNASLHVRLREAVT